MDLNTPTTTPPIDRMMQFFGYAHLPQHLQAISKPFGDLAQHMVESPFLDRIGIDSRPISFLLKEAYLQGVKDSAEAMSKIEDRGPRHG